MNSPGAEKEMKSACFTFRPKRFPVKKKAKSLVHDLCEVIDTHTTIAVKGQKFRRQTKWAVETDRLRATSSSRLNKQGQEKKQKTEAEETKQKSSRWLWHQKKRDERERGKEKKKSPAVCARKKKKKSDF